MNENEDMDQPENETQLNAEPSKTATNENIFQAIRKIQEHMKFLEKKIDWLLEKSNDKNRRPSHSGGPGGHGGGHGGRDRGRGGFSGGRNFNDRSSRPFRSRDRNDHRPRNNFRDSGNDRPERFESGAGDRQPMDNQSDPVNRDQSNQGFSRPKGNRQILGEWKMDSFSNPGKPRRHH